MAQKDPSRTEDATPKQIRKAREKGNVHKSQDVTQTLTILIGVIGLVFWLEFIGKDLAGLMRHFCGTAILTFKPNTADINALGITLAMELAKMLLPILLLIGLAAYIVLRVQVGKLWTTEVFSPKLSKFNPVNGVKRMFFSLDTWVRLAKNLLQALCIGVAPWLVIKAEIPHFSALYYADAATLSGYILKIGYKMTLYALVPMILLAVVDYLYTRWEYNENLKMTKDEVKDERKQMEGDPLIKNKMRQKMMQMSARRMMQEVPKADVVITNPTHIAVALRYNTLEAPAPVIVAMGADRIAEKIKEIARENTIPIRENVPLARALYKQADVGDMIPEDLYQAVAAVLAQIWKARPRRPQLQTIGSPRK